MMTKMPENKNVSNKLKVWMQSMEANKYLQDFPKTELNWDKALYADPKVSGHKVYINMIMHLLNKHPKDHAIHEIFYPCPSSLLFLTCCLKFLPDLLCIKTPNMSHIRTMHINLF